jgi:hypothetical protein
MVIILRRLLHALAWTEDDIASAQDLALIDRRPGPDGWTVKELDAVLLVLAARTAELVGAQPSLQCLSVWRAALEDARDEDMLVVRGPLQVDCAAEAPSAAGPVISASVAAMRATVRRLVAT